MQQIEVKAIGINRAEVMYRSGEYTIQPRFPATLGYEASGVVAAVGSGVKDFAVGDAVSVVPAFSFADYGMYGERVNAPVHAVVKNPPSLSFEDAAATWMMFATAYGDGDRASSRGLIFRGRRCPRRLVPFVAGQFDGMLRAVRLRVKGNTARAIAGSSGVGMLRRFSAALPETWRYKPGTMLTVWRIPAPVRYGKMGP